MPGIWQRQLLRPAATAAQQWSENLLGARWASCFFRTQKTADVSHTGLATILPLVCFFEAPCLVGWRLWEAKGWVRVPMFRRRGASSKDLNTGT